MTANTSLARIARPPARDSARLLLSLAKSAALEPYRPILVNLIVTRRCNLSCGYCFEYDKVSNPVPPELLEQRIDHLARLGTVMVALTGGETLLHPHLVEIVECVRKKGMTPVLNTNGYLLTRERILDLNRAGLFALQLSIDNVRPNQTSKKSLKPLLPKLRLLAELAEFRVRVNTVLGSGPPAEAVAVARAVVQLGLDAKVSLVRDRYGALIPLDSAAKDAYAEIVALEGRSSRLLSEDPFHDELVRDGQRSWKCRAGARYFHVCENGLVHYCSANMGKPGKPLATYAKADLKRAFYAGKLCATTCTQAYAHQVSRMDQRRSQEPAEPMHLISVRSLIRRSA